MAANKENIDVMILITQLRSFLSNPNHKGYLLSRLDPQTLKTIEKSKGAVEHQRMEAVKENLTELELLMKRKGLEAVLAAFPRIIKELDLQGLNIDHVLSLIKGEEAERARTAMNCLRRDASVEEKKLESPRKSEVFIDAAAERRPSVAVYTPSKNSLKVEELMYIIPQRNNINSADEMEILSGHVQVEIENLKRKYQLLLEIETEMTRYEKAEIKSEKSKGLVSSLKMFAKKNEPKKTVVLRNLAELKQAVLELDVKGHEFTKHIDAKTAKLSGLAVKPESVLVRKNSSKH